MSQSARRMVIVAAGSAMAIAFAAINVLGPPIGTSVYLLLVGVACAGYVAALASAVVAREPPSGGLLVLCIVFAVGFRAPLLMTEPGNDVFRYVWDAQVGRAGYNPYLVVPSDPALSALQTDETKRINNPEVPTPYPPGAQLFFRLVFHFSERSYAFKIALAFCDLALGFLVWRWLAAIGAAPGWLIVYAWNPLVILVTSGEGHLDALGVLVLMASVLFLTNGRRLASALCFALAVVIKPLPVVLAPLYWRRVRLVDGALAAGLVLLLYYPYMSGGGLPIGSLGLFVDRFRFNQTLFSVTSSLLTSRGAAALAVIGGLGVAAALRSRLPPTRPAAWVWPMAAALVLSPVVYPWYLVWLVPFLVGASTVPLIVWSITILSTYSVWHLAEIGGRWDVPGSVLVIEYGAVMASAVWVALHASRRRLAAAGGNVQPAAVRDRARPAGLSLSVLIPTFEEESALDVTLTHTLRVLKGHEVIVVDAGSSDRTAEIARRRAKLMTIRRTRGAALNEASAMARGDVLLFLHADTMLPPGAAEAIESALVDPDVVGGAFRFSFDDQRWGARAIGVWVNARSALLNVFLGDQALFVRRDAFLRAGGFRDWSIMEDLEILGRLRRFGRLRLVSPPVITSARRHRQRGYVKTVATIWLLTWLNLLGVPGPALARLYRPRR